jgi:excisionase family DNA binding protein
MSPPPTSPDSHTSPSTESAESVPPILPAFESWTLTIPETARRLRIGRRQAYEAAARGEIPTIRIGARVLVPVAALERMLSGGA